MSEQMKCQETNGGVLRTLSIIGIVWFSVSLISVITFSTSGELAAAAGWGMLGLFYAIPFAVICYRKSRKPLEARAIYNFATATTDQRNQAN